MNTTLPRVPAAIIRRAAAVASRYGPVRSTSNSRRHATGSSGPVVTVAAAGTTTVGVPTSSSQCSTASASVTSTRW
jgi:hypothetical protein